MCVYACMHLFVCVRVLESRAILMNARWAQVLRIDGLDSNALLPLLSETHAVMGFC